MPKGNWGTNSKAAEAKAREQEKKQAAAEKKQKEAEDAYWKDDDKLVQRKSDRREEKQKKHEEELRRREENRKLLDMESQQLTSSSKAKSAAPKLTRAQVDANREKAERDEINRLGLDKPSSKQTESLTLPQPKIITNQGKDSSTESDDEVAPLEENINRVLSLSKEDGSARNVDQALVLMSDDTDDAHPEKRMKKAHKDFEDAMMAKLKAEHPTMRRSQLKEMIWREWQRAPQNPLNKAAKAAANKASDSDQ